MSDTAGEPKFSPIRPPTPLGRKLVRYVLGFGVGIAVGLAPYLGLLDVPLFKPLLSLIPDSVRDQVIPLSAALMGAVAVVVQWYAGERLARRWLRRLFARTLGAAVLSFILLTIIHSLVVVTLPIGRHESASYVVGFTRPVKPLCTAEISNAECIKLVTTDPAEIASFWGDRQVQLARLSLIFSYLLFTGSFGTLIGLIILREGQENRDGERGSRRDVSRSPDGGQRTPPSRPRPDAGHAPAGDIRPRARPRRRKDE